ncbi:MAG TPA: type I DNA topoisomerase [Acidimicrobiia bacterium]|jgi:DNA topoisomerase-1|nr:type I DNA topoisomerase [Acidimicrobiia bacterium]
MPTKLVIVESPAKARTIAGYLGDDFVVESSIGHIRDLPRSAADVPASMKGEPWARLGVDVENDFKPLYVVPTDKKKQVTKLKKLLKEADELYLATDEDREGESIAWHLLEVLNPKQPVHRMVFHEITPAAIREAVDQARDLDRRLVDAQEARRILDRLFGYEVSPVLWRKVRQGLSAGRVQSPATRIIVERERERMAFVSASYWGLNGTFSVNEDPQTFSAGLVSVDDVRVATGKDFGADGQLQSENRVLLDEEAAVALSGELADADFEVSSVEAKPYTRKPYPPFRTSTLQQEAGRKLRFGARRTMSAAQRLYEGGFITYMRTDSTTLSSTALDAARSLVTKRYGVEYLPDKPRTYAGKVKNAQEAHEAVRPAGDEFKEPEDVVAAFGASSDEARLYDLIWKRTVASQMKDAKGESLSVRLRATGASGKRAEFGATGKTITFPGFLRAYVEGSDDPDAALDDQERPLPVMAEGDAADVEEMAAKGSETKPPARFTEASLIKRLEELGIGRPSTYASIISTIQDRGYVNKRGTALVPTFTAFAAIGLLEQHFEDLVDYAFTARMEDDLDRIATGEQEAIPWLNSFYFGNGHHGLQQLVAVNLDKIDAREINSIPLGVDADGEPVVARVGRYGPYVTRGDERASVPGDIAPDELTLEQAIAYLEAPSDERVMGTDPESGLTVIAKAGRYGPYVQLGELDPDAKPKTKPKTASLFKTMSLDTLTMEDAMRLLSQPRIVGQHPDDGTDITAQNGRYGPYLKWGKETRSLEEEEQIFSVTLDQAVAKLKEPKRRRGASSAPLKELGDDPEGKPIVVKNGRYGPYVTDGEYNASLKQDDTVESITLQRALDLIQARKDRGPAKKKRSAKK